MRLNFQRAYHYHCDHPISLRENHQNNRIGWHKQKNQDLEKLISSDEALCVA